MNIEKFIETLLQNNNFVSELSCCESYEELKQKIYDVGIILNKDEIIEIFKAIKSLAKEEACELNETELEYVSGGTNNILHTLLVNTNQNELNNLVNVADKVLRIL